MTADPHRPDPPAVPEAPSLPDVESPPPDEVLDGVPSVEEIVGRAEPAEQIVDEQPSRADVIPEERG